MFVLICILGLPPLPNTSSKLHVSFVHSAAQLLRQLVNQVAVCTYSMYIVGGYVLYESKAKTSQISCSTYSGNYALCSIE